MALRVNRDRVALTAGGRRWDMRRMGSAKAVSWARMARSASERRAEVCGEGSVEGGWREVAVELGLGDGF